MTTEGGGGDKPVQITGARPFGRGPEGEYFAFVFVFLGTMRCY